MLGMLNNPFLHLGLGMLSQAGPSPQPTGLDAVGRGGLLGMQSFQQAQQLQSLNELRQAQIGKYATEATRLKEQGRMPFQGKGMTAQAANQYIDQQTRAFQAANPDATPDQVAAFRRQMADAMAKRYLMTPTQSWDPVTGGPRITQPPVLPTFDDPLTAQSPAIGSPKTGRRLTEKELSDRNYPPGTDAVWGESGVPKVIHKPSEQQQKAAHFAARMGGAEKDVFLDPQGQKQTSGLTDLETTHLDKLTSRMHFLAAQSGPMGESVVSSEYRRYLQYARTWISGLLRYDSGAAVPEEEFWRYFVTNFAMPGDDDITIRQKQRARMREQESLNRTGRLSDGTQPWIERQNAPNISPGSASQIPPPPGFIED